MVDHAELLPNNRTPLERLIAHVDDPFTTLSSEFDSITSGDNSPPPAFLPFLVWQYGLGELSPYLPNLHDLIREGLLWQRQRGTPAALFRGLGWLGYSGKLEEAPTRRRRWNLFQVELDRVRDNELPDLTRIDGIASLSPPLRSVFWRGFAGYDIRALEYSRNKWSQTRWSTFSGVRIEADGAKWSFGRTLSFEHPMTQPELEALDVWLEDTGDVELPWLNTPWPDLAWNAFGGSARPSLMLLGVPKGTVWGVFRDAAGDVIGYRRAKVQQRVATTYEAGAPYRFGGLSYAPVENGAAIYLVEILTDFGDGFGSEAHSVSLILAGNPVDETKPGALWLGPGELDADLPEIAVTPVTIPFGRTVRERVRFLLRF